MPLWTVSASLTVTSPPKALSQFLALPRRGYSVAVKTVGFGIKTIGLKPCSATDQLHDLGQVCLTSTCLSFPNREIRVITYYPTG